MINKRASISSIAEIAGVSPATVSRVLNHPEAVRPDTLEKVRNVLKQYVQRGKLDVFITYEDYAEENVALKYNEELAGQYLKYFRQMAEKFGLKKTAGSDHHQKGNEGLAGIISRREITSNKILLNTLTNQDYTLYEKKL